ncbi:MAG: outer membrane lipid asymmetry maintenance protein MlaD [Burkholderiaceae bacterium]|nr:MAG: outer membrane lipid asymmetry maintenance protein MlaD [Burkholderiaceae bacterium]
MQRKSIDFLVGLFIVLGFVALLFLSLKAGNLGSFNVVGSYPVQAKFDNIGGLKLRSPVKSSGVVVGRITEIKFDDKTFQAVVTMSLENRYHFPKDTSAKILTAGLLGEQYVGLEAGGDEKSLAAGDHVPFTQSAVVLENLISQFLYNKAAEGKKE